MEYMLAQLVEALRYKPEGLGFNSRLGRPMDLGSTQSFNRNEYQGYLLGVKAVDARANNLAT
jgi:hypothetical protein